MHSPLRVAKEVQQQIRKLDAWVEKAQEGGVKGPKLAAARKQLDELHAELQNFIEEE